MKILKSVLLPGIIALMFGLSGCVKGDFDVPEVQLPKVDFQSNTTIAQLKESYSGFKEITDDIIIQGVVTANDESGNLYKKMVIQDETGAIELSLDQTNLYNTYPVGQRVYVKAKGMYIGDYNNLIQLGYLYNGTIGRLPETYIKNHLFRDSLPGPAPAPAVIELGSQKQSQISELVTFKNVHFNSADIGKNWADADVTATNRTLKDDKGNSIIIRTSSYANFANDKVPDGYGDVTGILTIFGSTWQLTIRDLKDVANFTGSVPTVGEPKGTGTKDDPYNVAAAMQNQGKNGVWVQGYIVGVYEASVSPFTPSFTAPFTTNSNILIAGNPDVKDISLAMPVQLPIGTIREVLNLKDNPTNKGKIVKIQGDLTAYFSIPGMRSPTAFEFEGYTPPPQGNVFFSETFSSGIGAFTAQSVTGSQAWRHDASYKHMIMSGYQQQAYANEDWLISPAINLSSATTAFLSFDHAINYGTNLATNHTVWISKNNNTGLPSTATWEKLEIPTYPTGKDWNFVNSGNIAIPAAYLGQNTVRIAFKYLSTTSEASSWEVKNVKVADK